jgi:hypothetical protein
MKSATTTASKKVRPEEYVVGPTRACRRSALVAIVGATLAGCLPAGSAPVGQHLLSDRTLSGVHFSPSETEGVPSHLLVTGPAQDITERDSTDSVMFTVADLYEIPADTGSGTGYRLGLARLLAEKCLVPQDDAADYPVQTDIRGRLLFVRYSKSTDYNDVVRMDLATGTQEWLGGAYYSPYYPPFVLSPGRTRVIVGLYGMSVVELDGESTSVSLNSTDAPFVGEDLYYGAGLPSYYQTRDLWRLVPYGQPELLDHNTYPYLTFATDQGPRLILARDLATETLFLLLDPGTLQEAPLPSAGAPPLNPNFAPASPDGHWLVLSANPFTLVTLFNWVTSETQEIDASDCSGWEWRPGHDELWIAMTDGTLRIWKPRTGVTAMPVAPVQTAQAPSGTLSFFTSDGNYWFSLRPGGAHSALYVGSADDPSGTAYQVTPAGAQEYSYWQLADGRILAGAWTTSDYRKDYYLVDPRTGATQGLAVNGLMVALGHTRALAHVNWEAGPATGDLCLIDLATGAQTLLAQNVYATAVDPGVHADVPTGTDALAAGTRIAFLVRNRIDSPYDGVWVAELP